MPKVQIAVSQAQLRKMHHGQTIQLSHRALAGEASKSCLINVTDKVQRKIQSCLRRGVGMRLSDYEIAGSGIDDDMEGDGFNFKKLGKYAQTAVKIGTAIVPKSVALQAVSSLPGGSTLGQAGVSALYASQGRGLFSRALSVAKTASKYVPKSVVQSGLQMGLQKAGLSAETAQSLSKVGTNAAFSAVQNAPTGSGLKGLQAMKDKMAKLRAMRKQKGGGIIPIGQGLIAIGSGSRAARSSNPLIIEQNAIADNVSGDFLRKKRP